MFSPVFEFYQYINGCERYNTGDYAGLPPTDSNANTNSNGWLWFPSGAGLVDLDAALALADSPLHGATFGRRSCDHRQRAVTPTHKHNAPDLRLDGLAP